jgi:hypothetical protein
VRRGLPALRGELPAHGKRAAMSTSAGQSKRSVEDKAVSHQQAAG